MRRYNTTSTNTHSFILIADMMWLLVADEFIAELKDEIAELTQQSQQMEQLQADVSAKMANIEAIQTELAEADQRLAQAKAENKALYLKLAASRTGPGENKPVAQTKEELYADLTGLIVRDVRRVDKEDVFDCIQTGRNGSKSRSLEN